MTEMKELLREIPKSELHMHLRGATPVKVFTDQLNKHPAKEVLKEAPERHLNWFRGFENIRPFLSPRRWSVDEVSNLFCYETFDQFLETYLFTAYFFREISDLRRLVKGVVESLRSQNVVYAEITISLIEYLWQGITLEEIKTCLEEFANSEGVRVQWIVDLVRDIGSGRALALLEEIVELQCKSIVGITLGGSEHLYPSEQFSEVYSTARRHGLRLTVHAGEALGPESVWEALESLSVERIGHGVRAIEDDSLVQHLAENKIPLEVCPTSNIRTGVFPSYEAHPVKALFEAGVPVTINSDDPTFFGTTLADEYDHIHALGVQDEGILQMLKNGFKFAFMPEKEKERYLHDLEEEWQTLHSRI